MKKLGIPLISLLLLSLIGCQAENSSSLDATAWSGAGAFAEAKDVFSRSCVPCHQFQAMTEDQFKSQGLVIVGDLNNSKMYYRLVGSGGSQGPKNMPTTGSLSTNEFNAIVAWIQSVQ